MKLNTEPITEQSPCWAQVCALTQEAFPPEEYLPPVQLVRMAQQPDFDFLALRDGGRFVGFAAVQLHGSLCYLFFLAIAPDCRGQGYGGRAVKTLCALYPGRQQVVDLEMLDPAAANSRQRERRRDFYLRCGYKPTGQFLSYLGVDYEVLCMDDAFDAPAFRALMASVRIDGFHPTWFTA